MDIATTRTQLSIDEFERLPEPEQGGGNELDEGEPVYAPPNSSEQAEIIQQFYALLKKWAQSGNHGIVAPNRWIALASGIVRAPDVAYIPRKRISKLDPKHSLKVVPALAIEVLSSYNTAREMARKLQQYRDAGVDLIWVVDPDKCEVEVYSSLPLKILRKGDVRKDGRILPGLCISVGALFEPAL